MATVAQTNGASNASDFQPPTNNPQKDVGGNLQPNTPNLQPAPKTTGTQQSFPTTDRLTVLGIDNTSSSAASPVPARGSFPVIWWAGLVFVILALVIIIRATRPKNKKQPKNPSPIFSSTEPEPKTEPAPVRIKKSKGKKPRRR